MAFTPFLCLELPGGSTAPTEAGKVFWGNVPGGKRDSGGWEGLSQLSTGLSTGHWDSSPCSLPASLPPQSLLEQPQDLGTLSQPLLPALQ